MILASSYVVRDEHNVWLKVDRTDGGRAAQSSKIQIAKVSSESSPKDMSLVDTLISDTVKLLKSQISGVRGVYVSASIYVLMDIRWIEFCAVLRSTALGPWCDEPWTGRRDARM